MLLTVTLAIELAALGIAAVATLTTVQISHGKIVGGGLPLPVADREFFVGFLMRLLLELLN